MDLFDFAELSNLQTVVDTPLTPKKTSRSTLEQAALAFVVSLNPDGIGRNVPTRNQKYRASAAGFWKHARHKGAVITKTVLVMMYDDIGNCFADCEGREARLAKIDTLQLEKTAMEKDIRRNEPNLAAADDLFSEFRTWDYSSSTNTAYHRLCRKLELELEKLCKGSKLERIRQAGVADQCYLAVPANLVRPELIPAPWGIVELKTGDTPGPQFKLLREAPLQNNVTPEMRSGFAFNIGSSASGAVCFANGVDRDGTLRRPPRKRGRLRSGKK